MRTKDVDIPYFVQNFLLAREPDNTGYRKDRSYQDFERYLEKFPDTNVVELDVVELSLIHI